ncbi:Cobalamin synthase [Nonomuraea solani]|uniref:Adenosylcobinamide-GDP ribazoletransferase n=1 Tax=Nonomuraea solani TaxID=1144553 RepID=A0A1H6DIQ4_9ACTN|nr:adenosylcobinamide-GDP ribazoletransferase [Nonomuraea solani]SEG85072.1 Cobalamin synthase [Nonomuraea solani]
MRLVHGLRFAVGTLSIFPVRVERVDREIAGQAMALAPAVGLALGLVAGLPSLLPLPPLLGAALALGLLALLTRGLHLDGLADLADGLGSGKPAPQALDIMKKSDIGPFGVITLVFTLLIQTTALASAGYAALVTACVAGRLTLTWACRSGVPAARPDGLGAMVAGTVRRSTAWLVTLTALLATAALGLLPTPATTLLKGTGPTGLELSAGAGPSGHALPARAVPSGLGIPAETGPDWPRLPAETRPDWPRLPAETRPSGHELPTNAAPSGLELASGTGPAGLGLPSRAGPGEPGLHTEAEPEGPGLRGKAEPGGPELPADARPSRLKLSAAAGPNGFGLPGEAEPGGPELPENARPGRLKLPAAAEPNGHGLSAKAAPGGLGLPAEAKPNWLRLPAEAGPTGLGVPGVVAAPVALLAGLAAALLLLRHARRRLGGITGDVLGALVETATATTLVATVILF